jgi:uncharacterized protein (UPF0332 family)
MSNSQGDFNPKAFLALAKKLVESPDDPAAHRTVISRSYYAAFLLTRTKLGLSRAAHAEVWEALKGLGGAKWWLMAHDAQNLRRQRNSADYGGRIYRLADEAKKAIGMADRIVQEIAGIEKVR